MPRATAAANAITMSSGLTETEAAVVDVEIEPGTVPFANLKTFVVEPNRLALELTVGNRAVVM